MEKGKDILFKIATDTLEFSDGKEMFQQYADSLGVDLAFQDFESELHSINIQYGKPKGALLLAYAEGKGIGCAGLRSLHGNTAELKRMFVQPRYQGHKIGQRLLEQILMIGQELGYKKIMLDTLPTMKAAQHLYRSYGFYEITPYRFNPLTGTIFMEKILG